LWGPTQPLRMQHMQGGAGASGPHAAASRPRPRSGRALHRHAQGMRMHLHYSTSRRDPSASGASLSRQGRRAWRVVARRSDQLLDRELARVQSWHLAAWLSELRASVRGDEAVRIFRALSTASPLLATIGSCDPTCRGRRTARGPGWAQLGRCSAPSGTQPEGPNVRASSVPSLHWGNGKEGYCGALGVSEVAHLPTHPGEEQCAFDEGKSRRGRLGHRIFWPSVRPEPGGDEALLLVEAPRRGGA
jgi:hypothetical protein